VPLHQKNPFGKIACFVREIHNIEIDDKIIGIRKQKINITGNVKPK